VKVYLILEQGSKQYKLAENEEVVFEKLAVAKDEKIELSKFGRVLFLSDKNKKTADEKELKKVRIKARIIEHFQGDKVIAFKYKAKKDYRRKLGHRQLRTRVLIESISAGAKSSGETKKSVKPKKVAVKKETKKV